VSFKWDAIEKEVLPWLSKAAIDAKEQEFHRCLVTIEGSLLIYLAM
jgi:hypothetical protein